jgi:putative N6-adenine-specific DNA methylase
MQYLPGWKSLRAKRLALFQDNHGNGGSLRNDKRYELFAACAPGFERVTGRELLSLGIASPRPVPGGVEFKGFLAHAYRVNLWSRTTERVILRLNEFRALTFKELHRKAARTAWEEFLPPGCNVSIRVTCRKSRLIHAGAVAERIVNAIGDRLGWPSSLLPADEEKSAHNPFLVVRIADDQCTVSLDTSGELLHFRGYRQATAKAPLRETLAAALLLASGWTSDRPLLDPFCGSGTLPIEAALIARRIAPGRHRRFAFMEWSNFDRSAWNDFLATADESCLPKAPSSIQGSDRDAGAVEASRSNAARAGVSNDISFERLAVSSIEPAGCGFVVTNPPYGRRVSEGSDLRNLYAQFGNVLRKKCPGWHVATLAGSEQLQRQIGLDFGEPIIVNNGGIRVLFVQADVPNG